MLCLVGALVNACTAPGVWVTDVTAAATNITMKAVMFLQVVGSGASWERVLYD